MPFPSSHLYAAHLYAGHITSYLTEAMEALVKHGPIRAADQRHRTDPGSPRQSSPTQESLTTISHARSSRPRPSCKKRGRLPNSEQLGSGNHVSCKGLYHDYRNWAQTCPKCVAKKKFRFQTAEIQDLLPRTLAPK